MGFTVLPEKRPLQHCFSLVFEELKMKAKYPLRSVAPFPEDLELVLYAYLRDKSSNSSTLADSPISSSNLYTY